MSATLQREAWDALNRVLDPCSVFNGTRLSLVELGMVEEVRIENGRADILLFLDDPTCLLFFEIHRMVVAEVGAISGVDEVSVELKADEIWTEERMTRTGRERLEAVRDRRRELRRAHGSAAPGWPLPRVSMHGIPLPIVAEEGRCAGKTTG